MHMTMMTSDGASERYVDLIVTSLSTLTGLDSVYQIETRIKAESGGFGMSDPAMRAYWHELFPAPGFSLG